MGTGMLMSGRRRQREALAEYSAAEHLQAQLEGSHALMRQLTSWRLATQARLGQLSEARRRSQHLMRNWQALARSVMPARPSASPRATRPPLSPQLKMS